MARSGRHSVKAVKRIAVIGGGSWGTTLAGLLARKGFPVRLWVYEPDLARTMQETRENPVYLPGYRLPARLEAVSDMGDALERADLVVFVVPSHAARNVLKQMRPHLKRAPLLVNATKGIETDTLLTMSELFREIVPEVPASRQAFLSGPSFAKEVARGDPTAVVVASHEPATAQHVQRVFSTPFFRVYTNPDVTGVELGGALKNVIAIAAGVSDGLGYGHNTRAALITRGLVEMARLGEAMGANPRTFAGLAGMGDLVLTCTGDLSRNRRVGLKLGQGMRLKDILAETPMVAEGIRTAQAAYRLSRKYRVEMPITEQVYLLLYRGKKPSATVRDLMGRALKPE